MTRHATPRDALPRAVDPVGTQWSQADHLLADISDHTRLGVWLQTKDGRKGRRRPDPWPRPGQKPKRRRLGSAQMSLKGQVQQWLAARRAKWTCTVPECQNPAGPDGPCAEHEKG